MTTIRIEGQLTSTDVDDLTGAYESANPPLRLDLSGLHSADRDGIRALQFAVGGRSGTARSQPVHQPIAARGWKEGPNSHEWLQRSYPQ